MKIKFLGASGTVTGSCYLLTSDSGESILVDCGLFQGTPEIDSLNYGELMCDVAKLEGVVLTHAHLDHCGRLPMLVSKGLNKPVYMTAPTKELTIISLYDTAKINKEEKWKKPLYEEGAVDEIIKHFQTVEYSTPFKIGPFSITMRDAGHIIGSASLEIVDENARNEIKKVAFSGDLGNSPEPLVRPTELIDSADIVVMESTYGDRLHPKDDPAVKVQEEINKIESSGGVLLIPAFSIERSQEILHLIAHLKADGKVKPATAVIFDSPMGEKATQVFEKYSKYYNEELKNDHKNSDPFSFQGLNVIERSRDSREVDNSGGPKVIIAGSGMMTGGRIINHAINYLPIATTTLLIVGYQGEGTLGRKILEGQKKVKIEGQQIEIKGSVTETQALSSHADQNGLLAWFGSIKDVKKLFLTHGENGPRGILEGKIKEQSSLKEIILPTLNQEFEL